MNTGNLLRSVRERAGFSLREFGRRAGTSHATLVAYGAGRVSPSMHTVERMVHAAGFELEPALVRSLPDRETRGRELLDVLELAEQFPARHRRNLAYPVFGRT
ncbi:MAG: helix-turn-helix domain-containing protein [Actinomycetia bacterium]|nr:helix-turn-helix domain-containing protein [Actinomycetes bacterium]